LRTTNKSSNKFPLSLQSSSLSYFISDTSASMDIGRDAEEIIISHQKQTIKPEDDEDEFDEV
jgi:hypothetical protein